MEIREYRLGEVVKIISGKKPNNNLANYLNESSKFGLPFPKQSDIQNYSLNNTKWFFDKNNYHLTFIESGDGLYFLPDADAKPFLSKIKFCMSPSIWKIVWNNKLIVKKYLFYLLLKNKKNIDSLKHGTTIQHISKSDFLNLVFIFPNINIQQQIINIIEPFEKINKYINFQLSNISSISKLIINRKYNKKIMIDDNIFFEKGINFNKLKFVNNIEIPFINISAINNNINKYVSNQQNNLINVNHGNVILSLDGTPGIVNNFIYGINGYGYKLTSNKYKNYQIYYSLLANENQTIIKNYSFGTTIKHATKAKNNLLIYDFEKYSYFLCAIYNLDIFYKKINNLIKNIIMKLIDLYIK